MQCDLGSYAPAGSITCGEAPAGTVPDNSADDSTVGDPTPSRRRDLLSWLPAGVQAPPDPPGLLSSYDLDFPASSLELALRDSHPTLFTASTTQGLSAPPLGGRQLSHTWRGSRSWVFYWWWRFWYFWYYFFRRRWVSLGGWRWRRCPRGTYTRVSFSWYRYRWYWGLRRHHQCAACPMGRYGNSWGLFSPACSGVCQARPGYYCPAGYRYASPGLKCPVGATCGGGASIPVCTAVGSVVDSRNRCSPCRAGTYGAPGSPSCALCPAGTYGLGAGLNTSACSGNCTAAPGYHCPAGSRSAGGSICPAGTYRSASNSTASCISSVWVQPGNYTPAGSTQPFGVQCPAGFTCPGGVSSPVPVPAGYWAPAGSVDFKICPAGVFSLLGTGTNESCIGNCSQHRVAGYCE